MWDYLPVSAFYDRTWSDYKVEQPSGMGWHNPRNLLDWQAKAAMGKIDQDLVGLAKEDPSMYYEGDFNELLDRRQALAKRMKNGPVA